MINLPLTQKQETFCLKYVECGNGKKAALLAGYKPHSKATFILRSPGVQARIAELRQKAEDATIMTIVQRKQRLTEFARAKIKKNPDPIHAIDILNRMDNVYAESVAGNTQNIQINIICRDEKARELVSKIVAGERLLANGNYDPDQGI